MPIHQFPSPPLPGSKPKGGTPNGHPAAHASTAQLNGYKKASASHSLQGGPNPRCSDTTGSPLSSLTSSTTRDQSPGSDDDDDDDFDERTAVGPSSGGMGGLRRSESGGVSADGSEMEVDEPEESDWDSEEDDNDNDNDNGRVVVHVEVRTKGVTHLNPSSIERNVRGLLVGNFPTLIVGEEVDGSLWGDTVLGEDVERVFIAETVPEMEMVARQNAELRIHLYSPSTIIGVEEFTTTIEDDDENVPAATVRELPAHPLEGLWESLVYADDLKPRLLNYIHSTIAFSQAEVDFNVVTWNRVVLLHGPPGTGKTSLCRALAQKLSIRLSSIYSRGKLVEINSHSLFSKWFSESGKLVQKLFSQVTEMVEDEGCFVVVMIDEVESLTAARSGAANGTEPSDALRVVNALLTQLDKLKTRRNVLVMTTSNIAGAIDSAFVDRADIKEYVDYPPPQAIYWILSGCLQELMSKGLARRCQILDWKTLQKLRKKDSSLVSPEKDGVVGMTGALMNGVNGVNGANGRESGPDEERNGKQRRGSKVDKADKAERISARLAHLAEECHASNLAGRFLRRLPVLSHARYMATNSRLADEGDAPRARSVEKWVEAMERVVRDEKVSRGRILDGGGKVEG